MADDDRPRTLPGLLAFLELPIEDLQLNCIFCKKILFEGELWGFTFRGLRLVWRGGYPHGVCFACLERELHIQGLRHHRRTALASGVEAETGKALGDLKVRCLYCAYILSHRDLAHVLSDNGIFYLIGERWRTICPWCKSGVCPPGAICMRRRRR